MRGTLHNRLLVCAFALILAGCGSGDDGTIPPDQADDLLSVLEAMQDKVDEGDCDLVDENAEEFVTRVNALPNDVDPEVTSELTKAADNLRELANDPEQCAGGASGLDGVQTDTTETDTTEEPTTTETEAEEPTTTVTEESTTEEEPEDEEPAEPSPEPEPGPEPEPPAGAENQGGGNVTPTPGGGLEPPSGGVGPGGGG